MQTLFDKPNLRTKCVCSRLMLSLNANLKITTTLYALSLMLETKNKLTFLWLCSRLEIRAMRHTHDYFENELKLN